MNVYVYFEDTSRDLKYGSEYGFINFCMISFSFSTKVAINHEIKIFFNANKINLQLSVIIVSFC